MLQKSLAVLPMVVFAAGCATQWHNPDISDPKQAARQQAMDEAYCSSMAGVGQVQAPPPRIYAQGYDVSGTVNTIGSGGYAMSTYTGTVRPQIGFASGLAQGQAAATPLAMAIQQRQIIELCMTGLGWTKDAPK